MTQKLKLTVSAIVALIVSILYFLTRLFDGFTFVEQSAPAFGRSFVYTSILLIILVIAVFAMLATIGQPNEDEVFEDERDLRIEHKADRIGYYTLSFGIVVLLLHYAFMAIYPGPSWILALNTPFQWAAIVTLLLFLSELVKWVSVFILYRR